MQGRGVLSSKWIYFICTYVSLSLFIGSLQTRLQKIVIKDSFCEIKHHKNVSLSLKCFTYLSSFRFEYFYLKKKIIFRCFLIVYNIVFFICHFCIEYWFSLKFRLTTSINVCLSDTCGISKDLLSIGWGYKLQEEINIERLYRITVHLIISPQHIYLTSICFS